MTKYDNQLRARSEAFIRKFFRVYLEERDFEQVLPMLHPEVTWFGTGAQEVCHDYGQAVSLLEAERSTCDVHFQILQYWAQSLPLGEGFCAVFGEMKIIEDSPKAIVLDMDSRFSMICAMYEGRLTLYHAHFSMPSALQGEDEFVHNAMVADYNQLLEAKLQERTAQLKEKTIELESLANNISGGLQICSVDEGFTIRYVSDGFLKLLGYSRDELLKTPHLSLVHPEDVAMLRAHAFRQFETGPEFSMVYRIVRKNGELRWVLDNGSLFDSAGGQQQIQSFLTDITAQKLQEEALRISQKRYEITMRQMDVSMFEYNIETRQLTLYEHDASLYGVSTVIEDGPRVLAESGHFDAECVSDYLEMYRKICSGEEISASCQITAHDVDGKLHEFELSLTAVLDQNGKPIHAIGVKRNATHLRRLQREQEFGKTMAGERSMIFEADITNDRLLRIDPAWSQQMGMADSASYSKVVAWVIKLLANEDQQRHLEERLDAGRLVSLLGQGRHLDHFTFQNSDGADGKPIWYEATVNIIRDEGSNNVCVRFYYEDISDRRHKEAQAVEERRLYDSMVAKAMVAYEVNISRDLAVRGHERWCEQFGITINHCYSDMIRAFMRYGMDAQDGARFLATFERQRVLRAYYDGERELVCQYRKRESEQGMLWVECTLHLFEDPESGEIRGYSYVENIDKQKRAELALRYQAEHDAHTNLFNKGTTAERIGQYLEDAKSRQGTHAFLMVDLDHFKSINDRFGHLFGDHVITELSARMRALFSEDDIVGRIGGDEFCVLLKEAASAAEVEQQAQRLCAVLTQSYSKEGSFQTVSASVGIALYPVHGKSFEELYRHADGALYEAKRRGRNCYAIAEGTTEVESHVRR